jgi:uncharacterized membrane protein
MLCQFGPSVDHSSTLGPFRVNAQTLCFAASLIVILLNIICVMLLFAPRFPKAADKTGQLKTWHGLVVVGDSTVVSTRRHVWTTVAHFCLFAFCMNLTIGVSSYSFFFTLVLAFIVAGLQFYMVCLQPVLVHYFDASQSFMANVALAYCGVAVIPPLIIALIANRLSSRSIVIIGLWLKVCCQIVWPLVSRKYLPSSHCLDDSSWV